jgi:hypothetical protein
MEITALRRTTCLREVPCNRSAQRSWKAGPPGRGPAPARPSHHAEDAPGGFRGPTAIAPATRSKSTTARGRGVRRDGTAREPGASLSGHSGPASSTALGFSTGLSPFSGGDRRRPCRGVGPRLVPRRPGNGLWASLPPGPEQRAPAPRAAGFRQVRAEGRLGPKRSRLTVVWRGPNCLRCPSTLSELPASCGPRPGTSRETREQPVDCLAPLRCWPSRRPAGRGGFGHPQLFLKGG